MPNPTATKSTELKLAELAERWANAEASERANFPPYINELTAALDLDAPGPSGSGYQFEYPINVVTPQGVETTHWIDLYKRGYFVLEAKDVEKGVSTEILLRKAFGQAVHYAIQLPEGLPPVLMVMDVGATLLVWLRRAGRYGGFNAARRIDLRKLADRPEDVAFLRKVWLEPHSLVNDGRAAKVTREIAERLAKLAVTLERRGHDQEEVARFLIRCVFTMFAEDEELLSGEPFTAILRDAENAKPDEVRGALEALWEAMDEGRYFGPKKLLRFNGHFFKDRRTPALTREDLAILREAAEADWREVEPTIFGTLLTRALDPKERHRLGAEYTPREYVERLIRPTIEEPIRERWILVEAEVLQLKASGRPKDHKEALRRLEEFHNWLRSLRFLDPACGSGNFLYVALATVKRIEVEVLRAMADLTGQHDLVVEEVGPWQFHGIEIKHWAREIAELTLWIGYHQFWREQHTGRTPPEPVLLDTGTLEPRDAVLDYDEIRIDPSRTRPDPTPRVPHPVTGELVPNPEAKVPYEEHVNPRQASWPKADFIIGNPPYMGRGRQREAFGDGYVDALRTAYPDVPDNADYVMYWWYRAAREVAEGRTIRAGLITTNTITQRHNRELIETARKQGAEITWAIADHPWVDETGSAAVRVAMTVIAKNPSRATLVAVDNQGNTTSTITVERLNTDLTAHADVTQATSRPLLANRGLSSQGFTLVGEGFRISHEEGIQLLELSPSHREIVRPLVNGRDLTTRPRGLFTVDFGLFDEEEAKQQPVLYDLVRVRVKPAREANKREAYSQYWWRYGEPRPGLRAALMSLKRYIATVETAKHRVFQFLPINTIAEHSVVCIALDDAFYLGVLSSAIHVTWALAAGGTLEDRPRYQKALCFDPFPFPDPSPELRQQIASIAEQIDQHRKDALERAEQVTITGIYNVIEKLRSGEPLSPTEREVYQLAACGVLLDLHNKLDRLVAEAYGWGWPLETEEILTRLVTLNAERAEEERAGHVRWLRPRFQTSRFERKARAWETKELALVRETATLTYATTNNPKKIAWPKTAIDQLAAIIRLLSKKPMKADELVAAFQGARRDLVKRHLETLTIMGEIQQTDDGAFYLTPA